MKQMDRRTALKTIAAIGAAAAAAPEAAEAAKIRNRDVQWATNIMLAKYGMPMVAAAAVVPGLTDELDIAEARATSELVTEALRVVTTRRGRKRSQRLGLTDQQIRRVSDALEVFNEALGELEAGLSLV